MKATKIETEMGAMLLAAHERADRIIVLLSHVDHCHECGETSMRHCSDAREIINTLLPGDLPPQLIEDPS